MEVYGCIITPSNGELHWTGDKASDVLAQLNVLPGTTYGEHWTFPRDTGLVDSNICLSYGKAAKCEEFYGKQAVSKFYSRLKQLCQQ